MLPMFQSHCSAQTKIPLYFTWIIIYDKVCLCLNNGIWAWYMLACVCVGVGVGEGWGGGGRGLWVCLASVGQCACLYKICHSRDRKKILLASLYTWNKWTKNWKGKTKEPAMFLSFVPNMSFGFKIWFRIGILRFTVRCLHNYADKRSERVKKSCKTGQLISLSRCPALSAVDAAMLSGTPMLPVCTVCMSLCPFPHLWPAACQQKQCQNVHYVHSVHYHIIVLHTPWSIITSVVFENIKKTSDVASCTCVCVCVCVCA